MTTRDAFDTLNDPARRNEGRYWGKYRGVVKDNVDKLGLGRILVSVPSVPGLATNWALPCAPYAGSQVGFYAIPPINAMVWVEFEGGDPTHPIWVGCFWQTGEVPTEVGTNQNDPSQVKVFKTRVVSMWVDDTDQKGQVDLVFTDPKIQNCPTVTMVLNSTGMTVTVTGQDGTSTITITPGSIQTNSVALGTTTSKDTTVTAQGNLSATVSKDVTVNATGKIAATAQDDASVTGNNCSFTANNNLTASATNSATVQGASATVQASTGSLTLSGASGATLSSTMTTKVSGATSLSLGGASIGFAPA